MRPTLWRCPGSDPSNKSVADDIRLREEPDEEDDEEKDDRNEEDDDSNEGYSE